VRRVSGSIGLALASALAFASAARADDPVPLANCKAVPGDYYAPSAIRLNKIGTVLVEYSVKKAGAPEDVRVVRSNATGDLQRSAVSLVKKMTCAPNDSWMTSGGADKRVRVNILFNLKGFDESAAPLDQSAEVITITAEAIFPRGGGR